MDVNSSQPAHNASLPNFFAFGLVNDEIRDWYESVIYFFTILINVTGFLNNIINMRVFVRQGILGDSTTFGLFTLAVYDMAGCFFMLPYSMCQVVKLVRPRYDFYSCIVMCGMPFAYPHLICIRTAGWVTVYISVERSLCVLMPMKVKAIIRPRMTMIAMVLISLFFVGLHVPLATQTEITFVFNPLHNVTVIVPKNGLLANTFVYLNNLISSTILSSLAILIVTLTTTLMVYKLFQSRKWRQTMRKNVNLEPENPISAKHSSVNDCSKEKLSKSDSGKDLEVIKTVCTVTIIYLVCLSMSHIPSSTILALPGVSLTGYNRNLVGMVYGTKYMFDAINAAANFFFYIRVSSRYKTAFNQVFRREQNA